MNLKTQLSLSENFGCSNSSQLLQGGIIGQSFFLR